jgi:glycosyltransferase involved in cell wall biosynthesis
VINSGEGPLGPGERRPRVLWDMTFTVRSMAGTHVYTHNLYQTLAASSDWEIQEIYGTRQVGAARRGNLRGNVQNVWWLLAGAEATVKRARPDLFHAAAYLGPPRLSCPMIVNVFDITYLVFPQNFDWKWHVYARTIIPRAIHASAAILTLSEHARGEIVRAYAVPREKVHIVAPGVGAEFQPDVHAERIAALRAKYGLGENYLLYVGNTNRRKNLSALIAGFARARQELPDLTFVLAGPRMRSSLEVERAVNEFGVAHVVRRLDFIPQQELPGLYASARAFFYASKLEGFGIPPVEAMACCTPVISAPNPPMPEVLGDAAFFTPDDSPEALAAGVVRVLTDEALQNTLRARGIERARLFTWENAAQKTLAVYQDVLQSTRH